LRLLFFAAAVSAGGQGARHRGNVAATSAGAARCPDDDGSGFCRDRAGRLVRSRRPGRYVRRPPRPAPSSIPARGAGSECRQMTEQGAEAIATTPTEFAAFIASETERFGKVVRAVGAKAE